MAGVARRRGGKEGVRLGLIAGVIFAAMQVVFAAAYGTPAGMPFRMFASILLGAPALETADWGTVIIVGSIVHLALSAAFGWLYGRFNARQAMGTQTGWGSQSALGLLYGVSLWLVNLQIIARLVYPWFLVPPQFLQMLMHAVCFGLPLGLMYAGTERRVRHMRRVRV